MVIIRAVVAELKKRAPCSVHCKVVALDTAQLTNHLAMQFSRLNCYLLRCFSRILTRDSADCFTKQQFLLTMTSPVPGKSDIFKCVVNI